MDRSNGYAWLDSIRPISSFKLSELITIGIATLVWQSIWTLVFLVLIHNRLSFQAWRLAAVSLIKGQVRNSQKLNTQNYVWTDIHTVERGKRWNYHLSLATTVVGSRSFYLQGILLRLVLLNCSISKPPNLETWKFSLTNWKNCTKASNFKQKLQMGELDSVYQSKNFLGSGPEAFLWTKLPLPETHKPSEPQIYQPKITKQHAQEAKSSSGHLRMDLKMNIMEKNSTVYMSTRPKKVKKIGVKSMSRRWSWVSDGDQESTARGFCFNSKWIRESLEGSQPLA